MKISQIFSGESTLSNPVVVSQKHQYSLHAEEFRQYLYCARIIYWRRIAGISGTPSYLMNKGTDYHQRRTSHTYERDGDIVTYRNRYFYNLPLRVGAILDVCREQERSIIAVEFKRFSHGSSPFLSHIVQALVGGLAAAYELEKPLVAIEIQYYQGRRISIEPTTKMIDQVLTVLSDIRRIINQAYLPPPTPDSAKCISCEYFKICRGV